MCDALHAHLKRRLAQERWLPDSLRTYRLAQTCSWLEQFVFEVYSSLRYLVDPFTFRRTRGKAHDQHGPCMTLC